MQTSSMPFLRATISTSRSARLISASLQASAILTRFTARQAQSSRLPQTKARYLLPCFATSKAFLSTTLPQSISFSATSMLLRKTQQSRASLTAYSQTSQRQTKMILFLQYSISFLLSRQTHSLIIQTSNTRIIRLNILQRLTLIS